MLLMLSLAVAFGAMAAKPPSSAGHFRMAESLLRSYLNAVCDHIAFRGENFLLLIGGDGELPDELMLIRQAGEDVEQVIGFHLRLHGLAAIVPPSVPDGSALPGAKPFGGLPGNWLSMSASEMAGGQFRLVIRSLGRKKLLRSVEISQNGNVFSP
jgi:hypothetical protein